MLPRTMQIYLTKLRRSNLKDAATILAYQAPLW
jgi:hypothetical protein